MDSLRGKLLLAGPTLKDPNFDRTVVLITEHNEDGAMGLVINRPSEATVGDAVPDLTWVADADDPDALAAAVRRSRVYAGHAGWGPGQLEGELAEEAWIVEPPRREELFSDEADGLWQAVLRRMGREFALLSTMPPDPSLN